MVEAKTRVVLNKSLEEGRSGDEEEEEEEGCSCCCVKRRRGANVEQYQRTSVVFNCVRLDLRLGRKLIPV